MQKECVLLTYTLLDTWFAAIAQFFAPNQFIMIWLQFESKHSRSYKSHNSWKN